MLANPVVGVLQIARMFQHEEIKAVGTLFNGSECLRVDVRHYHLHHELSL